LVAPDTVFALYNEVTAKSSPNGDAGGHVDPYWNAGQDVEEKQSVSRQSTRPSLSSSIPLLQIS
jgi:hypothetical protein